jgi:hypothetical protein
LATRLVGKADIEAGAFFTLLGVATALLSLEYKIGTAAEMGPGYFPLALGIALTLIGLIILIGGLVRGGEDARNVPLKPMFLIAVALLAFAVLVTNAGLIFAVPALVFISLLASEHFSIARATALSAGLLAFCYLAFVRLLGIPVPMIAEWASWIS